MTRQTRINELRSLVATGAYRVDPDTVATAMVARWMEERPAVAEREQPAPIARAA